MLYKSLVLRKLDELDNIMTGLRSLLNTSPSREQVENQIEKYVNKVEEIKTLVNVEQEG